MTTEGDPIMAIFAGIVMYYLIGYVVLMIWGVSHSNDRIDDDKGYLVATLWPAIVSVYLIFAICEFCKNNLKAKENKRWK